MVKEHSDIDGGNPLSPPHGLLFPISTKGALYAPSKDRIAHTKACVNKVTKHWL